MAERIRRSSGNVFTDAGFPPEEAAHLQIRTDLMIQLERILEEQGLTQAKAAKLLGISQPRISDLSCVACVGADKRAGPSRRG
jgi:predicted XRE-type DNA-binding protein